MNDELREKLAEGANASDFPACYWEGGEWMYKEEVVPLIEALRKVIIWAECVSARVSDRSDLNWRYLNEAREVLEKHKGGEG